MERRVIIYFDTATVTEWRTRRLSRTSWNSWIALVPIDPWPFPPLRFDIFPCSRHEVASHGGRAALAYERATQFLRFPFHFVTRHRNGSATLKHSTLPLTPSSLVRCLLIRWRPTSYSASRAFASLDTYTFSLNLTGNAIGQINSVHEAFGRWISWAEHRDLHLYRITIR